MSIFKAVVMILSCLPFAAMHAMHNVPQLVKGSIYLHNILDEKIDYQVNATITGDSGQGYFFENCTTQNSGEIAAHTTIKLFSGIVIDNQDVWGGPVELTLQTQNLRPTNIAIMEDIIGLYYIGKQIINSGTTTVECLALTKKTTSDTNNVETNESASNIPGGPSI